MTYLDYINYFWRKDREFFFKPEEVAIYFRLLHYANEIGWKAHFNLSLDRLMLEVGIKSRRPFDNARQRLREAELLDFKNGNGRGCTTEYTLLAAETSLKRVVKNTPLSGVLSATLSGEVSAKKTRSFREENVAVHKTKIKTKNIESIDSINAGKNSSPTASSEPAAAELWTAWLAEYTPTVQQLKSPLTGKQYTKLVADFGQVVVQEVLLAMENKADLLKKYTSANLTARDWCGRRTPQRPAPAPAPLTTAMPGAPAPIVPDLNPAVVAERQAQREAKAAEARRQFRLAHAEAAISHP